MRAASIFRARRDVVELLLCKGRVSDIQMLQFFNGQLSRECASAATAAAAAATVMTPEQTTPAEVRKKSVEDAASSAATAAAASAATAETQSAAAAEVSQKQIALESARVAKQSAWNAFEAQRSRVQSLAMEKGGVAWVGEVYGTKTWSTSFLSGENLEATLASPSTGGTALKITGATVAAGGQGSNPESVHVIAKLDEASAAVLSAAEEAAAAASSSSYSPGTLSRMAANMKRGGKFDRFIVATVVLKQAGVKSKMVNGLLQLDLTSANATLLPGVSAQDMATHQHVLTATAYSGILAKLEEVCALHATSVTRYDGIALRNPAMQMRLSQLACFRFGIEALTSYVTGDSELEQGEVFTGPKLEIPLIESMIANMYAEGALMDGLDSAWDVVRDTPLLEPRPHRSKPEKLIDYPYIHTLFHAPKYALTSMDGSMELQALEFLAPLLKRSGLHGAAAGSSAGGGTSGAMNALYNMMGMSSGRIRLGACHVNLELAAKQLESDISTLLGAVDRQADKADPTFVIALGQYVSEVLANLAVLYRCTASLAADEEGKGHREWLLTEAFCSASRVRRQKIMSDFSMAKAASKILKSAEDLDNYSTHPVELMNAAPVKAKSKSGSDTKKESAAAES